MRVYRASSLGYSLEALVAPHLGFEAVAPPEFLQDAFDEGNRIEPLAIEKLRAHRWVIQDEQLEVEFEVIPGVAKVVGHIDGIAQEGGYADYILRQHVLEVKSMADKSWKDFNKNGWDSRNPLIEKYKWQASAYQLATSLPHVMVAWNKGDKDGEGEGDLAFAVALEPFYTISDIARKLDEAEDYIERGLVPDGCTDFPCPYYYLHPPKDEVDKVEDGELEELLQSWLSYDMIEKNAKKVKDEYRASILALTGDALAAKVKGECGVTVETYWQEGTTYTTTRKEGWITRISGPRGKK